MHEQPTNDTAPGNDQPQANNTLGESSSITDPQPSEASPPSMGRPVAPAFEPLPTPPPQGPSKVVIGIAGAALVLVAFGIIRSMVADPEPKKPARPATPQTSIWHQQQRMAREAIDLAREAQQMQRERVDYIRRAQMESEFGFYDEEGYEDDGTP